MIHVVLFQPEIAPNTGNVGRMCAITCSRLHLIHPLGFVINDRNLRRAGMDYWKSLDVHEHADGDALVFGNEGSGAPDWLHAELHDTRVTIPQANPNLRSLNLSTAAGIACFEAVRQLTHARR